MDLFIGRKKELTQLRQSLFSNRAELFVLLGRRGVGKTSLINYFDKEYISSYSNCTAFYFVGNNRVRVKEQKKHFINNIKNVTGANLDKKLENETWKIILEEFRKVLLNLPKENKIFICIDEFAWLNSKDSGFAEYFGEFWTKIKLEKNVFCLLSGSSISWMNKKVLKAKGSLYHKANGAILLKPFSYVETKAFLEKIYSDFSFKEISQYYLATGGVPRYLERIKGEFSIEENFNAIFNEFNSVGEKEFDNLFTSTFNTARTNIHKAIVVLFKDRNKIRKKEIIDRLSVQFSINTIYNALEELEVTGIIKEIKNLANEKHNLYMLSDLFCFYNMKFFYKNKMPKILDNELLAKYNGYAFEILAFLNIDVIKDDISRNGFPTKEYAFYNDKCQIDLVIDYSNGRYSIVECKYYKDKVQITNEIEESILNKKDVFISELEKRKSKVRKNITVDVILFTPNGIDINKRGSFSYFDVSLNNIN